MKGDEEYGLDFMGVNGGIVLVSTRCFDSWTAGMLLWLLLLVAVWGLMYRD